MAEQRSTTTRAQDPAPEAQPDFGAPRPRGGMGRVQRSQLHAPQEELDPEKQEQFSALSELLLHNRPAEEIAPYAKALLAYQPLRQTTLTELMIRGRLAEFVAMIDDPAVGQAVERGYSADRQSDFNSARYAAQRATEDRAAFVREQYRGLEETVRAHYPGHWTAIMAATTFDDEQLGPTPWDRTRALDTREQFFDRALSMIPAIQERKRMDEAAEVHSRLQPVLQPILTARFAQGEPQSWVDVWSDVMNADRAFIGDDHAGNEVQRQVIQHNDTLLQAADRQAIGGLVRAEQRGGATQADHMEAYRTSRAAMEGVWRGSGHAAREGILESPAGANYDRLAEPLQAQTQTLIESYGALCEALRGDRHAGERATDASRGDAPRPHWSSDDPATDYRPLAETDALEDLQPVTLEEVGAAEGGAFGQIGAGQLNRDPIFRALKQIQAGGVEGKRGAIAIAQMADDAGVWAIGHQFYRIAFGVPEDLPEDKEAMRTALDQYKPDGGEFAAAWADWVEHHDIYDEFFNLKSSTWQFIASLTANLALAVLAGMISGGVGTALGIGRWGVVGMEALIFTVSSEAASTVINGHEPFEGGVGEFAMDLTANAATGGMSRMLGPGYRAVAGVDPAKLSQVSSTLTELAHGAGLYILENLAADGVAIGLAAAEAAVTGEDFTSEDAWDIVVTNAALTLGLKLGQGGLAMTRALAPARSIPGLDGIDMTLGRNQDAISASRGRGEAALGLVNRQRALLDQKDGLLATHLGTSSRQYQQWRAVYDFLQSEVTRFELVKAARLHQVGPNEFSYRPTPGGTNQVRQRLENGGIPHTMQPTPDGQMFTFRDPVTGADSRILPMSGGPRHAVPRQDVRPTPQTVFTASGVPVQIPPAGGMKHALESHTVEGFDPVARLADSPHDATLFKPGTVTNPQELHTLLRQALEGRAGREVVEGGQHVIDVTLRGQPVRVVLGAQSGGAGTKLVTVFPTRGVTVRLDEIRTMAADVQAGTRTLQEIRDELRSRF